MKTLLNVEWASILQNLKDMNSVIKTFKFYPSNDNFVWMVTQL